MEALGLLLVRLVQLRKPLQGGASDRILSPALHGPAGTENDGLPDDCHIPMYTLAHLVDDKPSLSISIPGVPIWYSPRGKPTARQQAEQAGTSQKKGGCRFRDGGVGGNGAAHGLTQLFRAYIDFKSPWIVPG